jgi:four helix bundle protein
MKTHKDLDAWKNAIELAVAIYSLTKSYPKEELFGLVSQMRRAAVSIPSNIAEGAGRNHGKEFQHFLYIALGSIAQLETQLLLSERLEYASDSDLLGLNKLVILIRSQIAGLIKYLNKQTNDEKKK